MLLLHPEIWQEIGCSPQVALGAKYTPSHRIPSPHLFMGEHQSIEQRGMYLYGGHIGELRALGHSFQVSHMAVLLLSGFAPYEKSSPFSKLRVTHPLIMSIMFFIVIVISIGGDHV